MAPKRILWIDDEVELFEPHLLFLRQRGYEVDTTTNGDDALELARGQSYDLVLLDEQMPGRRGLDVLSELRREEPHARIVMVTKSEEDKTLTEAIGRRVDRCRGWLSYVGTFGDDFFGDDDLFEDEEVTADAFA